MNKGLILGLFLLMSIGFTSAIELNEQLLNFYGCTGLSFLKSEIIGKELPSQVPFKNEIINVYVNGTIFANIEIKDKKISNLECEENKDRTYDIYVKNYSTIFDITKSEDKIQMIKTKMESKEIEIKGATFGKKIKWFFVKIGLKFS